MKFAQPSLRILLILGLLLPQPLLAQKKRRVPPPPSSSNTEIIRELLALTPLAPDEANSSDTPSDDEPKPPKDDAPIKELLAYWTEHKYWLKSPKAAPPSDTVRHRIFEYAIERPHLLFEWLEFFPPTAAVQDRVYRLATQETDDEGPEQTQQILRRWLQFNSPYFRQELLAEVQASPGSTENDFSEDSNLAIFAKLDWDAAKPLVQTFANSANPQHAALALALQYERVLTDNDTAQAERLRTRLQTIVTNRQLDSSARATACHSLLTKEWSGREDWFLSLFADPTLSGLPPDFLLAKAEKKSDDAEAKAGKEFSLMGMKRAEAAVKDAAAAAAAAVRVASAGYATVGYGENVLAAAARAEWEKWLPLAQKLIGNSDRTIHNAAVHFVLTLGFPSDESNSKDIARKFLPWLTDANWAQVEGRAGLIERLAEMELPECVPGLISLLDTELTVDELRTTAKTLAAYKSPSAAPALRRTLQKPLAEQLRDPVVEALAFCGGLSDEEMAAAIETYARKAVAPAGMEAMERAKWGENEKPLPLQLSLGRILFESQTIPATEGLALRLFERAKALRTTRPEVAAKILEGIQRVPLRVARLNLIERIGAGTADAEAIAFALEFRTDFQKDAGDEILALLKRKDAAAGIAAVLSGERGRMLDVLEGKDVPAQQAVLACARFVREKLPVETVAKLFGNPLLVEAAESYLTLEDSAAARALLWARHPGEAWILGEKFVPDAANRPSATEQKLQQEIRQGQADEVYAVMRATNEEIGFGVVIKIRQDKGEINVYEEPGRRLQRALSESELQELRAFTARPEIEDLGPQVYPDHDDEDADEIASFEYLRLNKNSGRRVLLEGLRPAPNQEATLHEALSGLFYRLRKTGDFKVRYDLEDKLPNVEVLWADRKQKLALVCKDGNELKVLLAPKRSEPGVEMELEWRIFEAGQLGARTTAPAAVPGLAILADLPQEWWRALDGLRPQLNGESLLLSGKMQEEAGVWRLQKGNQPERVVSGLYSHPLLTPDGKWMVAIKIPKQDDFSQTLIRHHLPTGKEFPLPLFRERVSFPIAFLATHNKVLLGQGRWSHGDEYRDSQYLLLDPATGTTQPVKGEFRPLQETEFRALQPSGQPDEYWAALPSAENKGTQIGLYDTKTFTFKSRLELDGVRVRSAETWVADGALYFVYLGHLLRVPLPK